MPTHITKLDAPIQVTLPIPLYFRFPKLCIRFWQDIIPASFVTMPKASVHEDTSAVFFQNNVRSTRQALHVDAKTKAMCEKKFPYNNLRLRILASDACHAPMPLFGCHLVCHGANVREKHPITKQLFLFQQKFIPTPPPYFPISILTNLYRFSNSSSLRNSVFQQMLNNIRKHLRLS